MGVSNGVEIYRIMPGSPLEGAVPKLQPRDRILWVQTLGNLGSDDQVDAFRKGAIPGKPVQALAVRNGKWFDVMIDYTGAVALRDGLSKPPDAKPGDAPKGGQP